MQLKKGYIVITDFSTKSYGGVLTSYIRCGSLLQARAYKYIILNFASEASEILEYLKSSNLLEPFLDTEEYDSDEDIFDMFHEIYSEATLHLYLNYKNLSIDYCNIYYNPELIELKRIS